MMIEGVYSSGGGGGTAGFIADEPDVDYICEPSAGPLVGLARMFRGEANERLQDLRYHVNLHRDMRDMPTHTATLAVGEDVCFTHPVRERWDIHFEGRNPQGKRVRVPREDSEDAYKCWQVAADTRTETIWVYYRAGGRELTPGSTVQAYMVKDGERSLVADISIQ